MGDGRLFNLSVGGVLQAGEPLVCRRVRSGEEYHATKTEDGEIELEDGRRLGTLSGAALAVSGANTVPG